MTPRWVQSKVIGRTRQLCLDGRDLDAGTAANDPDFIDPSTHSAQVKTTAPREKVIGSVTDIVKPVPLREVNFAAWFGASKVVDQNGRPLVVYHGTPTHGRYSNNRYVRAEQYDVEYPAFDTFSTVGTAITDSGWLGAGAYFTPDPGLADEFGNFLMPAYLKIERPFDIDDDCTSGSHNRFRFLKSLQSLAGLPKAFKLDLSMPPPQHRTDEAGRRYTWYYYAHEITCENSERKWRVVASLEKRSVGGIIEGTGATLEEAIFNDRYRYQFGGFLLHLIRQLGTRTFRQLLENNGYDGVIRYRDAYRDEPPGRYIREALVYEPTQIKSSIGNCGAFDPEEPSILR